MAKIQKIGSIRVHCSCDRLEDLENLVPNPRNPNTHPQKQVEKLAMIIRGHGIRHPITVSNRSGFIISGHCRLLSAQHLKLKQFPVNFQDFKNEAEEWAVMVADNVVQEFAETNGQIMADGLVFLDELNYPLELTALEPPQIEDFIHGPTDYKLPPSNVPEGEGIYSPNDVIEGAFKWFRKTGFPYPKIPAFVGMQNVNHLANLDGETLVRTTVGGQFADSYHPHRYECKIKNKNSSLEGFNTDKTFRRALHVEYEHNNRLNAAYFGSLNCGTNIYTCANFRPGYACYLYRRFCKPGNTILDTSAGYGGRLVGFMASGIAGKYIGIDPSSLSYKGNLRLAKDMGFADKVQLINLPAEDVPIAKLRNKCDFAFTSPPYFTNEHYCNEKTQSWVRYKTGEAWKSKFLFKMLKLQYAALKNGSINVVNIADVKIGGSEEIPLTDWIKEAAKAAGFHFVGEEEYPVSRFPWATEAGKPRCEPVFIFEKKEKK